MTMLRAGLIQMGLKCSTDADVEDIRRVMIESHLPLIERAGKEHVQVLCFQELFTQPYFCPSQDRRWYAAAELIPDGPTTQLMRELAALYKMVIVAPIFERDPIDGLYYNTAAVIDADGSYLGRYRKTHLPQVEGFWEKFFFRPGTSGWPVFQTRYCRLGVYICYDRHFPEGWRALALKGAQYIVNPTATVSSLSEYLWKLEQPAAAAANGCWIGAVNRVGREQPWDIGEFYGQSYFVNPLGEIVKIASRDRDELLVHDLDLDQVRVARDQWQFFRDRRPETYDILSAAE
ncbi:MAG TPA: nitrilase-related carbon-nitrogen hydrolase [Steroidobacteraceae bacterium]|jgi:N-carbamoylputrescine amidase